MDSVVHFEIPAKDVKRAAAFYKDAFGWKIDQFPNFEYWSIGTTEVDEKQNPKKPGAINGGLGKKGQTAPKDVTITISVADVKKSLASLKKLGGKQVGEVQPVGDMGWSAYFEDPEGNVIGLWQSTRTM